MIKWEQKDVKKYRRDIEKIEKLRKQYYSFYKTKSNTHIDLIRTISKTYAEQMHLNEMASRFDEKQKIAKKITKAKPKSKKRAGLGATMWKSKSILRSLKGKSREIAKQRGELYKRFKVV